MKVKFVPQNIEVEITPGKSILQTAHENNIEIRSLCKGVPSCAECRVRLVGGENNVLPPNKNELNVLGTNYYLDGRRLACQIRCFGDITLDLTEQVERPESQTKKIRGFRSDKQIESIAVQDTMILKEPAALPASPSARPNKESPQPRPHHHKNSEGRSAPNRNRRR